MRVDRRLWASALGISALLLAAGCSSKNPDALIGMNVDENLAMMNADENMDTNAAQPAAPAPTSAVSASNEASDETASAKPSHVAVADDQDQDAQTNEVRTITLPDEPTAGDQSEGTEDEPHTQY